MHGEQGEGADGDEAFFGAFSDDADGFVCGVDAVDIEGGEFGEAEAGRVEEFEDGGVALAHPEGGLALELGLHGEFEEFFDLGESEDDGEGLVGFGEFDFGEGAFGIAATVDEEFVKGAVGGEAEADGGAGEAVFLELEEVGSEVVGGEVTPFAEFFAEEFGEEAEGEGVVFEGFGGRVLFGGHELDEGVEFEVG
ncbi:MAG: hypothetical protein ACI9NQ_001173 [Paracoccaceae bacterium]